MSIFSDQFLYCCICGIGFSVSVRASYDGNFSAAVCSKNCWDEKKWRETLSIMGKVYYARTIVDDNKT